MKTLLSLLVILSTSSAAVSANIPFGYNCTSDLRGICDGDRGAPAPAAAAPAPAPAAPAPEAPSAPETTQPESEVSPPANTDN